MKILPFPCLRVKSRIVRIWKSCHSVTPPGPQDECGEGCKLGMGIGGRKYSDIVKKLDLLCMRAKHIEQNQIVSGSCCISYFICYSS
jgi:hypothetical protein